MWNGFKRLLAALSQVGPNLFEAEVLAILGYSVVIFNLNIDDLHKAAFVGLAVLVFTVLQAAYKAFEGPSAPPPVDTPKGI